MFKKLEIYQIFTNYISIFYDDSSKDKKNFQKQYLIPLVILPFLSGTIFSFLPIRPDALTNYYISVIAFGSIISPIMYNVIFGLASEYKKDVIEKRKVVIKETVYVSSYLATISILLTIIVITFFGLPDHISFTMPATKISNRITLLLNYKTLLIQTVLTHIIVNFLLIAKRTSKIFLD